MPLIGEPGGLTVENFSDPHGRTYGRHDGENNFDEY